MRTATSLPMTDIPADLQMVTLMPDGTERRINTYAEAGDAFALAINTPGATVTLPIGITRGQAATYETITVPPALAALAIVLNPKLNRPDPVLLERIIQSVVKTIEEPRRAHEVGVARIDHLLGNFATSARKARRDGKRPPRLEDLTSKKLFPALVSTALLAQTVCKDDAQAHMHYLAKLIAAESAIDNRGYDFVIMCGPLSPSEFVLLQWIDMARALLSSALKQSETLLLQGTYLPARSHEEARSQLRVLDAAEQAMLPPCVALSPPVPLTASINEQMNAMLAFMK